MILSPNILNLHNVNIKQCMYIYVTGEVDLARAISVLHTAHRCPAKSGEIIQWRT